MLEPFTNYAPIMQGFIFLIMSFFILFKSRNTTTSSFKNIFWAFSAFSIMKAVSLFLTFSINYFPSGDKLLLSNMHPLIIISTLSGISSVISNIFLFHFGISILTHRMSSRFDFKIFSVLIFISYITLYLSGTLAIDDVERISQYSLALNGAFLGCIGCLNLYKLKRPSGNRKLLSGLIICSIALLFYALTEGVIVRPVLGIQIEIWRLLTAAALLTSSILIIDLLKEEKNYRIGFI